MSPKRVSYIYRGLTALLTSHRSKAWTSGKAIKFQQEFANWRPAYRMCLSSLSRRLAPRQLCPSGQDHINALPMSHLRASLRPGWIIANSGLVSHLWDWPLTDSYHNRQDSCTAYQHRIRQFRVLRGLLRSFQMCAVALSFLVSSGWRREKRASRAQQDRVQLHTTTGATSLGRSRGSERNKFRAERGTLRSSRLSRGRTSWS
jgi:hypothetical protein